MVTWNNLDTLKSYDKLKELKGHVDIKEAMAGENGAKRVAEYTVPMASGLNFNYAAKQVDDEVLNVNSRKKQLTLQTKYMLVKLQTKLVKSSLQLYRSVSVVVI